VCVFPSYRSESWICFFRHVGFVHKILDLNVQLHTNPTHHHSALVFSWTNIFSRILERFCVLYYDNFSFVISSRKRMTTSPYGDCYSCKMRAQRNLQKNLRNLDSMNQRTEWKLGFSYFIRIHISYRLHWFGVVVEYTAIECSILYSIGYLDRTRITVFYKSGPKRPIWWSCQELLSFSTAILVQRGP
jgi:hypothetical protein